MISLENSHSKIPIGSEKNFGFVFSLVFLIISIYLWWNASEIYPFVLLVSFSFLFLAFFYPNYLKLANKAWFKFGLLLGMIVWPIVMGIIFFLTVTPTGIIMRLLGKDILKKKKIRLDSYWINKENNQSSMENQF